MKRYKLIDGSLRLPPRGGITAQGHAVSSFDVMVERDEAFAIQNGYYPLGVVQEAEPPLREGFETELRWELVKGCWQAHFTQRACDAETLL